MIDIKITIARAPAVKLFTVRKWGDPILYELDGMTTEGAVGSFQEVPLFHTDPNKPTMGYFNALSSFQTLGVSEKNFLYKIQPDDFDKYGFTVEQKINLMIQNPPIIGAPKQAYWIKEGGDWDSPQFTGMNFGTLVFGGQAVQVEMEGGKPKEYKFFGKYRNRELSEWISFYKLLGMRRSEMARPVAELLAEGKIQRYTTANRGAGQENIYNDHPRGVMYHPVWSPLDWRVNNGNDALYLAAEFCENGGGIVWGGNAG